MSIISLSFTRLAQSLFCFVVFGAAFSFAVAAFAQSDRARPEGGPSMSANQNAGAGSALDCAKRLRAFVNELDQLLASDPPTVLPIQDLFGKYFPIEKCNVDEAIAIARQSRFFADTSDERTYRVVTFDSKGVSRRPGFTVLVSFRKTNGYSEMPFVKVNGY